MKLQNLAHFFLFISLTIVLGFVFILCLKIGPMPLDLKVLIEQLSQNINSKELIVLKEIRFPRALLGLLIGATLGLAGASMQGFLRNPLAEPGVLGVTGGAVFGAVLVLYTGLSANFQYALPVAGILGALLSVCLLYFCAGLTASIQTLILAGVAINIIAFSGTSLLLNLSPNPYAALEIVFWQMGSLANRSMDHVWLAFPFILSGWVLLLWDRRALDILTLGEDAARSMGVSMKGVRFRIILGTALCVGAAVSVAGSIGFVGLVVPHMLRPFVGYQPGRLLGVSALGGAILLLLADIGVRIVPVGTELKLGVLTSLIGAPFFIAVIYKMRRGLT